MNNKALPEKGKRKNEGQIKETKEETPLTP